MKTWSEIKAQKIAKENMNLQERIDAKAYPPTHTYDLATIQPTGILRERWDILFRYASGFWFGGEGKRFLDVGANKGFFSVVARNAFLVDAIEPDADCAAILRDLGINILDGTFRTFAPPEYRYDRIFIGNAHHYAYRESGWSWVRKLAALTAPGGQVLIEGPLGNECADVVRCLPSERLADFTRERFLSELEPWFTASEPVPTTGYTPDRYVIRLTRHTEMSTSVDLAYLRENRKPIWENKANRSAVYDSDGNALKVYENPGSSLQRSLSFADVSPYVHRADCLACDADRFVGWLERKVDADTRFQKGWRERNDTFEDFQDLDAIFRAWCRHNAELARMGVVDLDAGPANWFRDANGDLKTFDKNSIHPIATLDPEDTDPEKGRVVRTMDWAYPPGALPYAPRSLICRALATRDSSEVERVFRLFGDAPNLVPPDIRYLVAAIKENVGPEDTVLDLGAGTRHLQEYFPETTQAVSVDGFAPDLFGSRAKIRGPMVVGYIQDAIEMLREDFFDVVLLLDVIEHFDKETAFRVLDRAKKLGRKICLFTPDGDHPQDGTPQNPLQAHRSAWRAEDLEAHGFQVTFWPDFHHELGKPSGALWAVWER